MPQRYPYTVAYRRKVESSQQGPPAKRRNWTRYWRRIVRLTWWLNAWKGKKHWYYQVTFIFVFRPKMNVRLRFRCVFGRKWNFIFVGIFVYDWKVKNAFRSACSIHHKKVLVLVLRCKVLVLVANTRLWSWSWSWKSFKVLVLKKGLDSSQAAR